MLHHLSIAVADIEASARFYDAVPAPLGYTRTWSFDTAVGYGPASGGDKLAIKLRPERPVPPPSGFHIACAAPDRKAVDQFHQIALQHGAIDKGKPGLRPHYGPNYYAAFVFDPDGYWLEAVINTPTE